MQFACQFPQPCSCAVDKRVQGADCPPSAQSLENHLKQPQPSFIYGQRHCEGNHRAERPQQQVADKQKNPAAPQEKPGQLQGQKRPAQQCPGGKAQAGPGQGEGIHLKSLPKKDRFGPLSV